MPHEPSPPRILARDAERDDLANVRSGFIGPASGLAPVFDLSDEAAAAALECGAVEVVDGEGVPIARMAVESTPTGARATSVVQWGPPPPPRPWQALHLTEPVELESSTTLVIAEGQEVSRLPSHVRTVLVLTSTGVEGHTEGNVQVRSAFIASAPTGARVVVVPLHPDTADRSAKAEEILRSLGLDGCSRAVGTALRPPRAHGVVVMLTGLSGSGKSTLARAVSVRLVEDGTEVTLLDGDRVRHHLSAGLGFSPEDRDTNVRRIGWVAGEIAHHGGVAICSPIAPRDEVRREVADMVRSRGARFVLVHVSTPLEECERRDRKGLYARARRGEIADFTGISAPYDIPESPDLRVDTTGRSVEEVRDEILAHVVADVALEWMI